MKASTIILTILLAPLGISAQDTTFSEPRGQDISVSATDADDFMIIRNELLYTADIYQGCPYKYASIVPEKGFDCSGFVYYLYNQLEIVPPRSSSDYKDIKPKLKLDEALPGDIVVFKGSSKKGKTPGHVGIITAIEGEEVSFIHSSTSRGVIVSKISEPYYHQRFLYAIRLIDEKQNIH